MNLETRQDELIKALDKLLRNVEMTDEERKKYMRRRARLSTQLDEVLRRKLDEHTDEYKAAIEQTNKAVKTAKRALRETEEREAVILQITKAAKTIDAVIKLAV